MDAPRSLPAPPPVNRSPGELPPPTPTSGERPKPASESGAPRAIHRERAADTGHPCRGDWSWDTNLIGELR
jgi:hypothetical protein